MKLGKEATIGAHRLVFEADSIEVHFGPELSEEEMEAILDAQAAHTDGKPYFLILDFTRLGSISAPVRRAVGRSRNRLHFQAIAMYGASFQMRIVAGLVNTGLALFLKRPLPQEFFDSRAAALAWIEKQRREFPINNS